MQIRSDAKEKREPGRKQRRLLVIDACVKLLRPDGDFAQNIAKMLQRAGIWS